jgi:hypothetical protein
MRSGKYTLIELWNDVESDYNKFIPNNNIQSSDIEDEHAYELARSTMSELIQIGREAEKINFFLHPITKANLGLRAKNLFREKYGPERLAPIKGIKSLAFVKNVILPFQENTRRIEHEWWLVYLCQLVGMDLAAETVEASRLAGKYREMISVSEMKYNMISKTAASILSKQGCFAIAEHVDVPDGSNQMLPALSQH